MHQYIISMDDASVYRWIVTAQVQMYIEDIQNFGMNVTLTSSIVAKNLYFRRGKATNEIYNFSLHKMK